MYPGRFFCVVVVVFVYPLFRGVLRVCKLLQSPVVSRTVYTSHFLTICNKMLVYECFQFKNAPDSYDLNQQEKMEKIG